MSCRVGSEGSTWSVAEVETVAFQAFVAEVQIRLSRAFVAAYGPDRGEEALAEALAYAWAHFTELREMGNPVGYLYRVGQSRTRPRKQVAFPTPGRNGLPDVEPRLVQALEQLSERQRVCTILVHVHEWTHQEVAELLGISASSVQVYVRRGLESLRRTIGDLHD